MNKKIKLLFIIKSLGAGGKERRFTELLTYLHKTQNYEIHIILSEVNSHYKLLDKIDVKVSYCKGAFNNKDIRQFFRFYNVISAYKPDIIHCWDALSVFYAILGAKLTKSFLFNGQITNATPKTRWSFGAKLTTFFNFKCSDAIISNSIAGIEEYMPPENKSFVIRNGLNLERFKAIPPKEEVRKKFGIDSKYVVLMIASYTSGKDYDSFLEVAKKTIPNLNNVTFVSIGAGSNKSNPIYTSLLNKLDSTEIKVLGQIDNVEELISISDIGLLFTNNSNHREGIPNSVLEFMASGKPVIANNSGGTAEVIRHNYNGYIYDKIDSVEVSNCILKLLQNDNLRFELGSNAYRTVVDQFTLDAMGKQYEDLYHRCLSDFE